MPDELSFIDGAQIACGYGTVYEGLERIGVNGNDALLVTGLGPVGLAALQLAKNLGARKLIGVDTEKNRVELAKKLKLCDIALQVGRKGSDDDTLKTILDFTGGLGCEKTVDCSGSKAGRKLCIDATRQWGSVCFIGEGGSVDFDVSHSVIHPQLKLYGSWVTSIGKMEELVERIVEWNIHPEDLVTDRFMLTEANKAYEKMARKEGGKVAVVFDEEDLQPIKN